MHHGFSSGNVPETMPLFEWLEDTVDTSDEGVVFKPFIDLTCCQIRARRGREATYLFGKTRSDLEMVPMNYRGSQKKTKISSRAREEIQGSNPRATGSTIHREDAAKSGRSKRRTAQDDASMLRQRTSELAYELYLQLRARDKELTLDDVRQDLLEAEPILGVRFKERGIDTVVAQTNIG